MTRSDPGPWWSRRRSRLRSRWPTSLPGIGFCAHGTLAYRVTGSSWSGGAAAAGADARLALDRLGRGITGALPPEQRDAAQEQLRLAAGRWHAVEGVPGLWMKARVTLVLTGQDADRAQRYQDALRSVTLRVAQEQEHRDSFRRTVLDRLDTARVWWLEQHRDDLEALDWGVFNDKILPLAGTVDDLRSTAEHVARLLQYAGAKLGDDPGQHARFVTTVRAVLDQMGWEDAPWPTAGGPAEGSAR
ncbi:hypothetical protein JHN61_27205 [Streptomyces sp. MBT67]|uniref:hypothetical protein n=1 Tax=unclassified Streptomyces TaxID=2593676 RepID=UPI00117DC72E|nr:MULTISPECIES: hypothetical protein [unclassified Streptomyces]MBK3532076.1 hypothetical protein [Streptomyces sp. MBT72]MBK3539841.1 hypothetical protein [Streptomyces sp. MBT67]MBK3551385.1 hypothetical protein [Streptomyces sp. MBT61]MBK6032098.1 hypothetical protein [Streptomyces sp. MBT59]